jgi:hypothetical protein
VNMDIHLLNVWLSVIKDTAVWSKVEGARRNIKTYGKLFITTHVIILVTNYF